MDWILLSIVSAAFLGCYDVTKKMAARANAVPVVLLASVTVGAVLWAPMMVWSAASPSTVPVGWLRVDPLSWAGHGMIAAKSVLVGASWTFALFGLKHLPLSIAAPIRSTSPLWTILIAVLGLGERPSGLQWVGIVLVVTGFWMFSRVGRREGIRFARNRWVVCMVIATLLGAVSSIYDKVLLQRYGIPPATLQAWFTVYLVPVMVPLATMWRFRTMWRLRRRDGDPFVWRRSVLAISPLLLAADLVYFTALANPAALVSIVSAVRRGSVIVPFVFGVRTLRERNVVPKGVCVAAILVGAALLTLSGG